MSFQYDTDSQEKPPAQEESQFWDEQLATYLAPYHERLDAYLDRREVGNLTATVAAIVQTHSELTTSALGSAICEPAHAEAGTQRLQRALHHQGWEAEVIEEVLRQEAEKSRQQMQQRGETPLCIWDSSVLEKPESEKLQGLGAVRSSRVRRLARSRKGVFNQPARMPVSVRGFEWESLLLLGQSGVPQVVGKSAKPGRLPAANAPGERRDCSGIRIVGSIAARGCSPCRSDTHSIGVRCGWWWCDRAGGVSPGICSPMKPSRRASKPGTSSSPT